MKSKIILSIIMAGTMFVAGISYAAPGKKWRQQFTQGADWQAGCAYETRGSSCPAVAIYFYKSKNEQLGSTDAIVFITNQRNWYEFTVAPYSGKCISGSVSIDGEKRFDLEMKSDYCQVVGGTLFAKDSVSVEKTLHIDMLKKSKHMDITLDMKTGEPLKISVPMVGFQKALEEAHAMSGRR